MYVTDSGISVEDRAALTEGDGYVAVLLDGKMVLFPTEYIGLDEFTVDLGEGCELYATNLKAGKWTDGTFGFIVDNEEKMLVTSGCGVKHFKRMFE